MSVSPEHHSTTPATDRPSHEPAAEPRHRAPAQPAPDRPISLDQGTADWVPNSFAGGERLYYVRFRVTAGTAAQGPELKTVFGRDYVSANGGVTGVIPAFDYAADKDGDGYLSDAEYATLQQWLEQGAPVTEQALYPNATERRQIAEWEAFLNAPGARQNLVSRWLYEHLFLAHLHVDGGEPGHFFQLVRSRTPSGQAIDPIATRRPNDDPGTAFHYRLWPIQGVIVHKTHITYPLSSAKLARVKELFFAEDWPLDAVPGYGAQRRANPFETFAAIPPRARYQFMLDNAEYFVRTFIRGPVCRGQIATDVIRDNFWTLFQDPQHDLYITDADYRAIAAFRAGLRRFLHFSEEAARAAGLSPQQHQLLLAIRGHAGATPPTIGELAEALQLKHHSVVGLVDRMVQGGFVERRSSTVDNRRVHVVITATGEGALRSLTAAHRLEHQRLRDLLQRLTGQLAPLEASDPETGTERAANGAKASPGTEPDQLTD